MAQRDSEHGLADAWGSDEQDVGGVLCVAAAGEVADEGGVDAGLGAEVEVGEAPGGGEVREAHPSGEAAGLGGVDFCGEELCEELGVGLAFGCGLVQRGGQRLGGRGHLEVGQVGSELLVEAVFGAHDAAWGWVRRR